MSMLSADTTTVSAAASLNKGKKAVNRTDAFLRFSGMDAVKVLARKGTGNVRLVQSDGSYVVVTATTLTQRVGTDNGTVRFVALETRDVITRAVSALTVDVPNKAYRVTA